VVCRFRKLDWSRRLLHIGSLVGGYRPPQNHLFSRCRIVTAARFFCSEKKEPIELKLGCISMYSYIEVKWEKVQR